MPSAVHPTTDRSGDLNLAIARPIFAYLERKHGRATLQDLATRTGIPEETLLRPQVWVSLEDFEHVLAATREIVGSDADFIEACRFDMVASYGPLALVFRTSTVLMSYRVLAATTQFASRISNYKLLDSSHDSVTLRYTSTKKESRLMCLSRQAQLPTVPLMFWNLPPGKLSESKCIARGDDCCEYHIEWSEPLAWRWPVAGALAGVGLSFAPHFGIAHATFLFGLIGALAGATFAFRRMVAQANEFHRQTTQSVGDFVKEHQGAIENIMALHQRQEAFNALLSERIEARTSTLKAMISELRSKEERSEVALRGASHDIRNPLQVARLNAHTLMQERDPDIVEMGRQIHESVLSVEKQMKRLLALATESEREKAFALNNERVDVGQFVDRVRKNLHALVIARDIRVSVFRTREAPDAIETDVMLFDRVIDNLMSNAVKYTERGSIVAEIGGVPDHLTFKLSDTGRGISRERLEKVFIGGQRDQKPLLGESHGIGLSSAVRLLDELGGRLEVMSKPGVGTTIWAHVPIKPPARDSAEIRSLDASEVLRRVVTIRPAANE